MLPLSYIGVCIHNFLRLILEVSRYESKHCVEFVFYIFYSVIIIQVPADGDLKILLHDLQGIFKHTVC